MKITINLKIEGADKKLKLEGQEFGFTFDTSEVKKSKADEAIAADESSQWELTDRLRFLFDELLNPQSQFQQNRLKPWGS